MAGDVGNGRCRTRLSGVCVVEQNVWRTSTDHGGRSRTANLPDGNSTGHGHSPGPGASGQASCIGGSPPATTGGARCGVNVTCSTDHPSTPPRRRSGKRSSRPHGVGTRTGVPSEGSAVQRPDSAEALGSDAVPARSGGTQWRSATPRSTRRSATACVSTTPTCSPPRSRPSWPTATGSDPTCAVSSSRWPRTAGSGSDGPPSTEVRDSVPSSSTSSSTSRCAPERRCPC